MKNSKIWLVLCEPLHCIRYAFALSSHTRECLQRANLLDFRFSPTLSAYSYFRFDPPRLSMHRAHFPLHELHLSILNHPIPTRFDQVTPLRKPLVSKMVQNSRLLKIGHILAKSQHFFEMFDSKKFYILPLSNEPKIVE